MDWINFPNRSRKEGSVEARASVSQTNRTLMMAAYKPVTTSKREKETESDVKLTLMKVSKKMTKSGSPLNMKLV